MVADYRVNDCHAYQSLAAIEWGHSKARHQDTQLQHNTGWTVIQSLPGT